MTKLEDIGPYIVSRYTVTNDGPDNLKMANLTVRWPYQTRTGKHLLYLIEIEGKVSIHFFFGKIIEFIRGCPHAFLITVIKTNKLSKIFNPHETLVNYYCTGLGTLLLKPRQRVDYFWWNLRRQTALFIYWYYSWCWIIPHSLPSDIYFHDELLNCPSVQCFWSGAPQEAVEWVFARQETLTKLTQVYPGSIGCIR